MAAAWQARVPVSGSAYTDVPVQCTMWPIDSHRAVLAVRARDGAPEAMIQPLESDALYVLSSAQLKKNDLFFGSYVQGHTRTWD